MNNKDYIIRNEIQSDYHEVENLVREAFWNVYRPGCNEHFLLHILRNDPTYIKELDFVMIKDNKIIGQNVFAKAQLKTDENRVIEVLTMGPICIHPTYKRKGYGKQLLDYSLTKAKQLGYKAVFIEGNIDFYKHSGFTYAKNFNIAYNDLPKDSDTSFFLVNELEKGFLNNVKGTYMTPSVYNIKEEDVEEFDKNFIRKVKLKLPGQIFNI